MPDSSGNWTKYVVGGVLLLVFSFFGPFWNFGLDSALVSFLSSEALGVYTQSSHINCQNNRGAKLAWAESGAEAVDLKRTIVDLNMCMFILF